MACLSPTSFQFQTTGYSIALYLFSFLIEKEKKKKKKRKKKEHISELYALVSKLNLLHLLSNQIRKKKIIKREIRYCCNLIIDLESCCVFSFFIYTIYFPV